MAKIPAGVGPKLPQIVVLFGATGDLAHKKLLPGLFHLVSAGFISKGRIIGVSLDAIDAEAFRAHAREAAPYDLVFANILARPLRLLAPSLAAVISADGDAIVSGLLLADVPGVLASWRAQGFHLAERIELEGWASLRLRR